MAMQDHILIVDDDAEMRGLLERVSPQAGLSRDCGGGRQGLRAAIGRSRPDLVVLDLMLPGEDGLTLCRDLRARSSIPIIMLTARGRGTDRIVGLEMGADDYLAKPFSPRELLARIKSVLRRARGRFPENLRPDERRTLRFAGWTLESHARHLVSPTGVVVPLSGTEFKLLRIFLAHPNRVLTRDQLIDLMLSRDAAPFDRSIDVQVSRLRHRCATTRRSRRSSRPCAAKATCFAAQVEAELMRAGCRARCSAGWCSCCSWRARLAQAREPRDPWRDRDELISQASGMQAPRSASPTYVVLLDRSRRAQTHPRGRELAPLVRRARCPPAPAGARTRRIRRVPFLRRGCGEVWGRAAFVSVSVADAPWRRTACRLRARDESGWGAAASAQVRWTDASAGFRSSRRFGCATAPLVTFDSRQPGRRSELALLAC